jgi:hypothetical protein
MRESKVESKVSAYAWSIGVANYKFTSPGSDGVPDRVFITHAGVFFIEFKATGRTLDPLQVLRIKEMEASGALVFVVDNVDDGVKVVDACS